MISRLLTLGLLTAGLLHAETYRDVSSQTDPIDPQGRIQIDDTNGSISIKTWARPEVSIQVEKRASSEDYLKEIKVEINSDAHSLAIKTTFPHHPFSWLWNWGEGGSVHLVLMVPESVNLDDIVLVNGGITIEGVHGSVEVHTVNGALQVTGLRNGGKLSTVNGAIHAEVAALAPDGHLHLSTVNGAILVKLARDANASIDASTVNGGTSCELPIRLSEEKHHGLHGVIGAGGGSISATTVNGGIHVESL